MRDHNDDSNGNWIGAWILIGLVFYTAIGLAIWEFLL